MKLWFIIYATTTVENRKCYINLEWSDLYFKSIRMVCACEFSKKQVRPMIQLTVIISNRIIDNL